MIFEDEHLLVVDKPAGWNTHAPSPQGGEGLYDWLRHRETRWDGLAILHRLDKETSGVLLFGKSSLANRSLTQQFTEHRVLKSYLLMTDRPAPQASWWVKSRLGRTGSRYATITGGPGGQTAETHFEVVSTLAGRTLLRAEPRTGRTHQIRVHAQESGIPVLGDTLYGGSPFPRVCLHAESITLEHPATGESRTFSAPANLESGKALPLRAAFIDPAQTTGVRLIHGAADGWPGWYVDRLGDYLLSQAADDLGSVHRSELQGLLERTRTAGAYHKRLSKQVRRTRPDSHCPQHVLGTPAPGRFTILENGLRYELSFLEGYSVGLFLDQRDNRRRLQGLGRVFVSPPAVPGAEPFTIELLNTFAYTCAFSVAAAVGGARVTSLDLSRKYLDWGRRNFELNSLDPECHDFIYGDAFDWMRRLHKKGRLFHGVILDPPTFSKSKQSGVFRAEKDYGRLIRAAVLLLRRGGVLLASTNAAGWAPSDFLETVRAAIMSQDRRVLKEQYFPQPPDFPINREEPGHLKTAWFHLD